MIIAVCYISERLDERQQRGRENDVVCVRQISDELMYECW